MPGELVEDVDQIAHEMMAAKPGMVVTRTEVARIAINEFVARAKKKRSK